jgi:tetratricopeptide (TPR) repeat protein
MHNAKIFISYSWENQEQAERIYDDLTKIGIECMKDNHTLRYKDSISEYMKSIREANYAIVLISDHYLKSKNCMCEAIELLKERDFSTKHLPILLPTAKFFKVEDRIKYIKYWEEKFNELQIQLKNLNTLNSLELHNDLKTLNEIALNINNFLQILTEIKNISYEELIKENYRSILNVIGYENISWAFELLAISNLKDNNAKELALDAYSMHFPANTHYYTIKGLTCSDAGKYEQAMLNYLQAIRLDPSNTQALNNLGWLNDRVFNIKEKAKQFYLKAIAIDEKFTTARLNLGTLLSDKFQDEDGAKKQYDAILSYDPSVAKAHNNLGNLARKSDIAAKENEEAVHHFNKAIQLDPKLVEAYVNLGNLLKVSGKIEEGNKLYRKAKRIANNPNFSKFINTLLKTNKG